MSRARVLTATLLLFATPARADIAPPIYLMPFETAGTRLATGAFVIALGAGVIWWRRRHARRPPPPQP